MKQQKKRLLSALLLPLCVGVLLSACADTGAEAAETAEADTKTETVPAEQQEMTETEVPRLMNGTMQLIPDTSFSHGFLVRSQKDHANGDYTEELGQFLGNPSYGDEPHWLIAQWDSGPCLWNDRVPSDENILTDGVSKWVTCGQNTVTLRLNTAPYYAGKPDGAAAAGDYWPHLLLECRDFGYQSMTAEEKPYFSCDSDSLMLSFDLKLDTFSLTPNEKDWVEADQFLMYFYIHGKQSNDFVWFGLQLFDSRWEKNAAYCALDGGKADASGSLIYSIGLSDVYRGASGNFRKDGAVSPDGEWVHIAIDLIPHLKKMFKNGNSMEYFTDAVQSLADLYIDGMNVGFETIGTVDTAVTIRNLSLTSTRK